MWRTFLRMLRPEDTRLKIDIPDEDTFDPDTYGIEPAEIRISKSILFLEKKKNNYYYYYY